MVVLAQQKALFYIAPAAWRGRIFSLQRVALPLAPMIASPIYGTVWEALGPTSVFNVACVFLVASAPALCYAYLVAVRHMRGKKPTQSELQ
jgi:MFS family permease